MPRKKVPCTGGCGTMMVPTPSANPDYQPMCIECRRERTLLWSIGICENENCGKEFTRPANRRNPNSKEGQQKYCTHKCAVAAHSAARWEARGGPPPERDRGHKKRCAFYGQSYDEWFDTNAGRRWVFERDSYICGICWKPIDAALPGNDRLGATVDCIVPLSRDGSQGFVETNVRCAHMCCNSAKCDRLDEECAELLVELRAASEPPPPRRAIERPARRRRCCFCGREGMLLFVKCDTGWRCAHEGKCRERAKPPLPRRQDAQWEVHVTTHLADYIRENGDALVKQTFVTRDGFALGSWVNNQRKDCRNGTIYPHRKERLEQIPEWVWVDPRSTKLATHLPTWSNRPGTKYVRCRRPGRGAHLTVEEYRRRARETAARREVGQLTRTDRSLGDCAEAQNDGSHVISVFAVT